MKRISRPVAFVLAAIVVGICSYVVWLRTRTPPLEEDARNILSEMEQGDGAGLYHYSFDHEKKALNLTPEKVDAVYKRLIMPRLQGFHPVGSIQTMVNHDASQAVAWQRMRNDRGQEFDLDASPWGSPSGGKQLVMARLMTAWIVEYCIKQGKPADPLGCAEARLQGLAHDRMTLDEIGVPGMAADNPNQPMRPWDEYTRYWEGLTEKLRTEKSEKAKASGA